LQKNANPYVPQAHSKLFITHSFTSRPKATQPSQQCRDKDQCRGGHGLSSQVACFCPVCLSTTATIECQEIIHITLSTTVSMSIATPIFFGINPYGLRRNPLGQGKYLDFSLCTFPPVGLYEKYGEEHHFVSFARPPFLWR
jgi:hypothetical protein